MRMNLAKILKEKIQSSPAFRLGLQTTLLAIDIWLISIFLLNFQGAKFLWFVSDIDSLRGLLGSIFQGLASFFAIVISVSLLVAQLAYGSFSPRLMPNFLKNRSFLGVVFLFIGALSSNLITLSLLSENTLHALTPLIIIDLILSLIALISVVPVSFILLSSAHPMNIGWDLIQKFDERYFKNIPAFNTNTSLSDDNLPLLQSLIVKSIRDADTDYARRLLGSFSKKIENHLGNDNAISYSSYLGGFFKKISFVASEEKEEDILQQIVSINEALEKKASTSPKYLSDFDTKYEGSFARNILYVMSLSIEKNHDQVLGKSLGAMNRLRENIIQYIPPDDEIANFITIKHFRDKRSGEIKNDSLHYTNERIFEYAKQVYFESSVSLASEALQSKNPELVHSFVRDAFTTRYDLEKLDYSKHKEAVENIAFSSFFSLSRLSQLAIKKDTNISDDLAIGVEESRDFFITVDPRLAESYVDLLGEVMIETTEHRILNGDPNATFYWAGVALRMLLTRAPINIPMKLLGYFEKLLDVISERQTKSSSPILEKMKETICREVASVKKYKDSDPSILKKAETILAQHPEVKLKE